MRKQGKEGGEGTGKEQGERGGEGTGKEKGEEETERGYKETVERDKYEHEERGQNCTEKMGRAKTGQGKMGISIYEKGSFERCPGGPKKEYGGNGKRRG